MLGNCVYSDLLLSAASRHLGIPKMPDAYNTTLVEHSIDKGDSRPIRQGLRRHPVAHLDIIDQQVDEMMRHDLVQPAASP